MSKSRLLKASDPDRTSTEAALEANGVHLPLIYLGEAAAAHGITPPTLMVAHRGDGIPAAALGIISRPAKGVPGHRTVHVPYFGAAIPQDLESECLDALISYVRSDASILRLTLTVFAPDPHHNERLDALLLHRGLAVAPLQNSYLNTLRMRLEPDIDDLFSGLHRSARRNIRELDKRPVLVDTIKDHALAPRMDDLMDETLQRTGGEYRSRDWGAVIDLSMKAPRRSRLVGMWRTDVPGGQGLIGFAWGCHHGDHAVYSDAAAARPDDIRIAVAYPLVWDLVSWAKATGAKWFDLGGVTLGNANDDDPLGGISDFKRFFTKDLIAVGREWQLPPHTLRAAAAQAIHRWRTRGDRKDDGADA